MNTIQNTLNDLKRFRFFILFVVFVSGLTTFVISKNIPAQYQASLSFTIGIRQKQQTTEYQYDGYYGLKAAELVSQTMMSWFLTPSVVVEMYESASLPIPRENPNRLVAHFRARQHAAQNIVVSFREPDEKKASKLADAIIEVIQKKGENLNKNTNDETLFHVVGEKPVIVKTKINALVASISAVVFGFLASLFFIMVIKAARNSEQQ